MELNGGDAQAIKTAARPSQMDVALTAFFDGAQNAMAGLVGGKVAPTQLTEKQVTSQVNDGIKDTKAVFSPFTSIAGIETDKSFFGAVDSGKGLNQPKETEDA